MNASMSFQGAARHLCALAVAVLAALPAAASPTLIGDSVTVRALFPDTATVFASDVVAVGAGVEMSCPSALQFCATSTLLAGESIDVGALSISGSFSTGFNAGPGVTFAGLEFLGLDFGAGLELTGVAVTSSNANVTAADVAFGANFLRIDLRDTNLLGPFTFNIDLRATQAAVPEPSSLALGGLALLAAVGASRRRRLPPPPRGR